jgi:tetratricopeptide (TPR) repeat protein
LAGPHSQIVALNSAAELRFRLGDWNAAIEKTAELEALAAERDFALWVGYARELRGQAFIHIGRVEEGLELMKEGAAVFEFTGTIARLWRIHYADALGRLGRADEALAMLTDIEKGLSEAGWAVSLADIHRLRGEILRARNTPDDVAAAEAAFRTAIDVAARQHARLFELRASTSLARLLDSQGRRNEAEAVLAKIYGQFTEGFGARDLIEAREVLARVSEHGAQAPTE